MIQPREAASLPSDRARIAVALVDDDPHFRLFLESVLDASARHRVAAVAGSAEEALQWPAATAPHVALLDIGLPGKAGSALVGELVKLFPGVLPIMLTAQTNEDAILESIRAGAVGYLLKGVDEEEIIAAIDDALAGGAPMSPRIARRVLALMKDGERRGESGAREAEGRGDAEAAKRGEGASAAEWAILTARERDVLERVAAGASNKEVAEQLSLALPTVKNALLSIYTKWRVRSRTEAALKYRGTT